MSKWAHIVKGVVVEVTDIDPNGRFHSDMLWVNCADNVDQRWTYMNNTFTPPAPPPDPPLDVDQILIDKISTGILITSNSTPALNAVYALDDKTMTEIGSVARDVSSGMRLPGGRPTFTYPDITGNALGHDFTGPQIIALYEAMRDLLWMMNTQAAILRQGGTPEWPPQAATII